MSPSQKQARLSLLKVRLRRKQSELNTSVFKEEVKKSIQDIRHVISFIKLCDVKCGS